MAFKVTNDKDSVQIMMKSLKGAFGGLYTI